MTPAAGNVNNISALHLKVNLKEKIYLYVNSTTQRCPNKIIKTFFSGHKSGGKFATGVVDTS